MKPIIGVITNADYDFEKDRQFSSKYEICEWIIKCGGIPVGVISPKQCNYFDKEERNRECTIENLNDLKRIIKMCDGFIKPGGYKILDYHKYIYNYCVENDVPYLGMCAGIQLMPCALENNVNLVENKNIELHKSKNPYTHSVNIVKNTKLHSILGKDSLRVNSHHKKHIESVNKLLISAISEDNQIEALEHPNCKYNIGLQWHPEYYGFDNIDSNNIFGSFIESSIEYQKKKR